MKVGRKQSFLGIELVFALITFHSGIKESASVGLDYSHSTCSPHMSIASRNSLSDAQFNPLSRISPCNTFLAISLNIRCSSIPSSSLH